MVENSEGRFCNSIYASPAWEGNSKDSMLLMLDILERVTKSSSREELLDKVGDAAQLLMQVEASSVMLLDEKGEYLTLANATGPVGDEVAGRKIPADYGYAGQVVKKKRPVIAADAQQDELFGGEISPDFTTHNLIGVPLWGEDGKVIGVLEALNRSRDTFSETDIDILQALANHASRTLDRIRVKNEIKDTAEEYDLIFRELHHRVKNDFALLSGIIQLENMEVQDVRAKQALTEIGSRINTLAAVHDLLANRDGDASSDIQQYFRKLVTSITENLSGFAKNITFVTHIEPMQLNTHKALSCGLILNELIVNSLKHAFDKHEKGEISISAEKRNGYIELVYTDNGLGFGDRPSTPEGRSLGFEIIQSLVKQLHAKLEMQGREGAWVKITFPAE